MKKVLILTVVLTLLVALGGMAGAVVMDEPLELGEGEFGITSISLEEAEAIENGAEPAPIPEGEVRITAIGVDSGGEVVATGTEKADFNYPLYGLGVAALAICALLFTRKTRTA